jgi:hypothetical protein
MAVIKRKSDIRKFLLLFDEHAEWDAAGQKWYVTLEETSRKAGGTDAESITVIHYAWEGVFTVYRASEYACDVRETAMGLTELVDELWRWRKALNRWLSENERKPAVK